MKLLKRRSDTAPKSLSTYRASRSEPATMAGRRFGSVTRQKVRQGPKPRLRAAITLGGVQVEKAGADA